MSGGSETTTVRTQPSTTTQEPWEAAQPAMKGALNEAMDIFDSGAGFQPYTASTVVPYSQQTQQGMQGIENQAQQGMANKPNTTGFLSDILSDGSQGLSQYQQQAGDLWSGMAQGDYGNDAGFNAVLDDATTRANMQASAGGRYGSTVHHGNMARELGKLQFPRQDEARRNLAGLGQQGIANRFGAAEAFPMAWESQFAPERSLMGVGSMYEDLMSRQMKDQARIFDATQQSPLKRAEWLSALASGAGSLGGTTSGGGGTSTTTAPGANPFLSALSGGAGLNQIFGNPLGGILGF